eukprot:8794742-Pyramimonas_sp.AAC.1
MPPFPPHHSRIPWCPPGARQGGADRGKRGAVNFEICRARRRPRWRHGSRRGRRCKTDLQKRHRAS